MPFVHLHTHSQYSILDASAPVSDLIMQAKAYGMPALALTDHGNLYGAIEFYKEAKSKGIQPIVGCELFLAPTSRLEKKKIGYKPYAFHLTFLAKNQIGYKNLCILSSIGYTEGFYYTPRIDFELLSKHKEGLICLSGCLKSPFAYEVLNGTKDSFITELKKYHSLFGEDFYLELQNHKSSNEDLELEGILDDPGLHQKYQEMVATQKKYTEWCLEIKDTLKVQCVATNNVHYLKREDWKAHEILLNVQSGEPCEIWQKSGHGGGEFRVNNPKRTTFASHEMYFKSLEEMRSLFDAEFLSNSLLIAEKCSLKIDFETKHYPVFTPKHLKNQVLSDEERSKATAAFLQDLCLKGIPERYNEQSLPHVQEKYPGKDPLQVVHDRLKYEMDIITSKEMCDYLLIVWDFIHWAKEQGIPVGPGRGSGAGSIILYLIGITDIEPLRFDLFFERFINPERVSYPDIDVDICMQRRSEVIAYTLATYGHSNVAQIITFGSMKAKMAIKDVGRVLSVPLAQVNKITKLIPEDLDINLKKALEKEPELTKLIQEDPDVERIFTIAEKLEGCIRSTGLHAAGLIIAKESLTNYIPVCKAKDTDMLATQYSMKPVEMVGMLKIDFLGLKTLTSIQKCVDMIKKEIGTLIDWVNLPLDDEKTFSLLNQGLTQGLFQIESSGMQELARQLHLDKFEEIIAVVALYRPGPMDMIPSFIRRKHGQEPIEYDHPWMEEILAETYGIMVYQEQVMQIASRLANYSLAEGDVLRRAMGKKDMQQMVQERNKFVAGAQKNGVDEKIANEIFSKMEKFAEYGFNKSHAAAYGYLSYVTAFLKANYPSQWHAALMTCDINDLSKITKFIQEARSMQIAVLPPDINESDNYFATHKNTIRFAMGAIKGVGSAVVETILLERNTHGPFRNLFDCVCRVDLKRVGKKTFELLIDSGCFDYTNWSRDALVDVLSPMYDTVAKRKKEEAQGMLSLFGPIAHEEHLFKEPKDPKIKRSKETLLFKEKELLGIFLSGHPLDNWDRIFAQLGCQTLQDIHETNTSRVFKIIAIIDTVQIKTSLKTQKRFAIMTLSDKNNEPLEIPVWSDVYGSTQDLLIENTLVLAIITKEVRENEISMQTTWLARANDLTPQVLSSCNTAYTEAKDLLARRTAWGSKKKSEKKRSEPTQETSIEEKKKCTITLDIDSVRMSHILYIKKIITKHPGNIPVQITFKSQSSPYVSLFLGKEFSIDSHESLIDDLIQLPCYIQDL